MTMFEYLMVMLSIILGLGVAQVLRGFGKIARSKTNYLPLTLWCVVLFYLHIQVWWALWDLSSVDAWSQYYFWLIISIPCCLFAAIELLMPMGSSPDTDWQEHFHSVRRPFMVVIFIFGLVAVAETYLLLGLPLTHPYRIIQGIVTSTSIIGFFATNTRIHVALGTTYLATILVGQVVFRLNPGLGL
jgi:hypothetical protein